MYLKRTLSEGLTLYKGGRFGMFRVAKHSHRYEVVLGLGGNIGDVRRRFEHLFYFLQRDVRVEILQTSKILKNPPFGYLEQDDFFNAVMRLKTSMLPKRFLNFVMRVEKRFARVRSFKDAPRSLDLDIIFFDNSMMSSKNLTLPHANWHKRESVVIPLMDIVA